MEGEADCIDNRPKKKHNSANRLHTSQVKRYTEKDCETNNVSVAVTAHAAHPQIIAIVGADDGNPNKHNDNPKQKTNRSI